MINYKKPQITFKVRFLKFILFIFLGLLAFMFVIQAKANTEQMNETMVRMINQIDALFPLIEQAAKEQEKNARIQFHFDNWIDANGVKHDGLRENLFEIRAALINQINQSNLTPKIVAPINGDYLGR